MVYYLDFVLFRLNGMAACFTVPHFVKTPLSVLELGLVCRLTAAELWSHFDFVLSLVVGDFDGLNGRHHYVVSCSLGAGELVYFQVHLFTIRFVVPVKR